MRGGVVESARSAAEQIAAKEMSDEAKKEVLDKADTLDENEAEAVAGGDECFCILGGGGLEDERCLTCACVAGGGGEWRNRIWNGKYWEKARCACPFIGAGV